jgi:hypothetical protein
MVGTTIPYGDRPVVRDDGHATFEFLQFLERLNKSANNIKDGGASLQVQITANANGIDALEGQVSTLNSQVATAASTATGIQAQVSALANRTPAQADLGVGAAIALSSGIPTEIMQQPVSAGMRIVIGWVGLTGTGTVQAAQASVSLTPATIDTDPSSFATVSFGSSGISPTTGLGFDLSIGSFVRVMNIVYPLTPAPLTLSLNVTGYFSGSISAYGSLIIWPMGA